MLYIQYVCLIIFYAKLQCLMPNQTNRFFTNFHEFTMRGGFFFVCLGVSQILTYARHLRPLSSEGSLACHLYCDTGHPFKMVMSEDPWHSHVLPSVWQWRCNYLFSRLGSITAGIRSPNLSLAGRTLLPAAALFNEKKICSRKRLIDTSLDFGRTLIYSLWI